MRDGIYKVDFNLAERHDAPVRTIGGTLTGLNGTSILLSNRHASNLDLGE